MNDIQVLQILTDRTEHKTSQNLVAAYNKWGWTPKQRKYANDLARSFSIPTNIVDVEMSNIVAIFDVATQNLKWPKICVQLDDTRVVFSRAGSGSRYPGSINITDGGPYGNNAYYGRIQDNQWRPNLNTPDAVIEFVQKFSDNPVKISSEYGRLTGNCCFCRKMLTDDRSTSVGYGPICAEHWGLPWG
jgi:hypothetical protein